MVIDDRLNAQTVRINFPLPLIDDILDEIGGRNIYSTFDLAWGYFQIPMSKRAAGAAWEQAISPPGRFAADFFSRT